MSLLQLLAAILEIFFNDYIVCQHSVPVCSDHFLPGAALFDDYPCFELSARHTMRSLTTC